MMAAKYNGVMGQLIGVKHDRVGQLHQRFGLIKGCGQTLQLKRLLALQEHPRRQLPTGQYSAGCLLPLRFVHIGVLPVLIACRYHEYPAWTHQLFQRLGKQARVARYIVEAYTIGNDTRLMVRLGIVEDALHASRLVGRVYIIVLACISGTDSKDVGTVCHAAIWRTIATACGNTYAMNGMKHVKVAHMVIGQDFLLGRIFAANRCRDALGLFILSHFIHEYLDTVRLTIL